MLISMAGRKYMRLIPFLVVSALLLTGLAAEAKTTLRFVKWPGADYDQATDPDQFIVDEFNRLHPEVEVILEPIADYVEKLTVNMAAGMYPDILIATPPLIAQFMPLGLLEELTPYAKQSEDLFQMLFPIATTSAATWDGLYAVPININPNALYFNVDEFGAAGLRSPHDLYAEDNWNWDTFLFAAKKLTIDTDGDNQPNKYGYKGTPRNWQFFVWQNKGTIFSPDGRQFVMDRAAQEAIQFASDLIHVHRVWTTAAPYYTTAFAQGLTVMIIRTSDHVKIYRNDSEVNWDTAMIFGRKPGMPFQEVFNLGGIAICSQSKHKELAWEFIKFVLGYEAQVRYALSGQIPINKRAALSPYLLDPAKPPQNMQVFLQAIEMGIPSTDKEVPAVVNTTLERELNKIWNRGEPVQQVLDAARPVINALLAEHYAAQ